MKPRPRLLPLIIAGVTAGGLALATGSAAGAASPPLPPGVANTAAAAARPSGAPGSLILPSVSNIYAGYNAFRPRGGFTNVSATWVQPSAECAPHETSYAYFWTGLGGVDALEQVGTASSCIRGTPTYFPWFNFVPSAEVGGQVIKRPVRPGDVLHARVLSLGTNNYELILSNVTESWTYLRTEVFPRGQTTDAFWMTEAPQGSLTHFATGGAPRVDFSNCSSNYGPISSSALEVFRDWMLTSSFPFIRAQPSTLTSGGTAFSVTWTHH